MSKYFCFHFVHHILNHVIFLFGSCDYKIRYRTEVKLHTDRQPVNETSVPSPSHVATTENISMPDATVHGQSDISPGQDNVNVVGLHEQDVMNISITNTELNGLEDTEASPEKTLNSHVSNHTPDVIVIDSCHCNQ